MASGAGHGADILLISIWPIFAPISLGHTLARNGFPGPGFWQFADRLNYFLLFPALLVSSLAEAPVDDPGLLRLGGAAIATILTAAGLVALLPRIRPLPAARFGPVLQGVIRFYTYLGLTILAVLSGAPAIERAAIYLAIAVPLVNLLSILALGERGGSLSLMARTVLRNLLILACLGGLGLALSGIGLPLGTGNFVALMGQVSLPLGLLCVGAALTPTSLRGDWAVLAGIGAARLLAMPVLAGAVGLAFGLSEVETMVLVVFSAVPTAPTAYALTRQMNGDAKMMAGIVTTQTLVVITTLPLVLLIFGER